MIAKGFYTLRHLRGSYWQAQSRKLSGSDVWYFVDEPGQKGLSVVGATSLKVTKVLRRQNHSSAKFSSLQKQLPQDIEFVTHYIVGLVHQEVGVNRPRLPLNSP